MWQLGMDLHFPPIPLTIGDGLVSQIPLNDFGGSGILVVEVSQNDLDEITDQLFSGQRLR